MRNRLAGHIHGMLRKCTSYTRFLCVTGETWKRFSTLISKFDNELVADIKSTDKIKADLFFNDALLFTRAVSADSLEKAWVCIQKFGGIAFKEKKRYSFSAFWFNQTTKKLLEGSFKYPNRIRVSIHKFNNRKRLVSMQNIRVKIIEMAILNALEPQFEGYYVWENIPENIYYLEVKKNKVRSNYKMISTSIGEISYFKKRIICPTIFYPESYGFRPKKSAHQALKTIRHWRFNTTFLIDYNISTIFQGINQKRLKNIFKAKIKDPRFWSEISKILNAGVAHELQLIFGYKKVFQVGVLSPFLYNIYMHEFDERVIRLQKSSRNFYRFLDSDLGKRRAAIKSYSSDVNDFATNNLKRLIKEGGPAKVFLEVQKTVYNSRYRKFKYCKKIGTNGLYLQYVRYFYDFIIGVVGSWKYAAQIRKDLNNFIRSNLHLEVRKDSIVHRNEKSIKFLNHLIGFREYKLKPSVLSKSMRAIKKNKHKSISKFLENDRRLAKSKSYQLYSNVLKQFDILSSKLNISVSNRSNVTVLASIIAYKYIGAQLMKKISVSCWRKFDKLLSSVNFYNLSCERKNKSALTRWFSYLQKESDKYSELSARILYSNIVAFASAEWHVNLSTGQAGEVKKLQQEYLTRVDSIIKKSLNLEIEKKRSKIVDKYYQNKDSGSFSKDILFFGGGPVKEFSASSACEFFLRKVSINAPIKEMCANLRLMGYIHPMKDKSVSNSSLIFYADSVIVVYINSLISSLLSWYSGVDNFSKVKNLARLLRKSCILTLANKHKKSVLWVQTVYGRDVGVSRGKDKIYLTSRASILSHRNKLDLKADFFLLHQCNVGPEISFFTRYNFESALVESCFVVHCLKFKNTRVHSICRAYDSVNSIKLMSIFNSKEIRIVQFTSVVIHLNRKRFSLCSKHYTEFKLGIFSPLDYFKLNKVC